MGTQGSGRKRSTKTERSTAEDEALNLIAREAEARLAAKRAARAEAREIRMKELERQQKEIFQVQKKYYGLNTNADKRVDSKWGDIEQWMEDSERYSRSSRIHMLSDEDERMSVGSRGSIRVEDRDYLEKGSRAASALTTSTLTSLGGTSSRRGSGETTLTVDAESAFREIKDTLAEVEEKYRKAMVSNAQLDNEKNNLMYQVDTLKDSLMELEELLSESRREYEEKVKEHEREKHAHSTLQFQFNEMKATLKQSEELLNESRQLRVKQDGFVREIADLQETLDWKDKKIGALQRQKEYTDAIRIERDELREEAVKLKDILKKHGIVLGPDLNINGDVGETEVDGALNANSSPSAQDTPTSPTEGNSMLGNTEEAEVKEVAREQQREMLGTAKENDLSSEMPCKVETLSPERPSEEQHSFLPVEEKCSGESSVSRDIPLYINDDAAAETKDEIICSPVLSPEEYVSEMEKSDEGNLKETSGPDLHEAETKSDSVDSKQEDVEESNMRKAESHDQQNVGPVVRKESFPDQLVPAVIITRPQEPENPEEAENDEPEEAQSLSQSQGTASGKKKKKKRGKKKAGTQDKSQQKDEKEKEKYAVIATENNDSTTKPKLECSVDETFKELKTNQVKNELDMPKTEEAQSLEQVECSEKELLEEPKMGDVPHENDTEQTLVSKTLEDDEPIKTLEEGDGHIPVEQSNDQISETEKAIEPNEIFLHAETLKEPSADSKKENQNNDETLEPESLGEVGVPPPSELLTGDDDVEKQNGELQETDGAETIVESSESFSHLETVNSEQDDEQTDTLEESQDKRFSEKENQTETLEKVTVSPGVDDTNKEKTLGTEPVDLVEVNSFPLVEMVNESRSSSKDVEDDQQFNTVEEVEVVCTKETPCQIESFEKVEVEHVMNKQKKVQPLETNAVELFEALENNDSIPHVATVKDSTADTKNDDQDNEQVLETEEFEEVNIMAPTEVSCHIKTVGEVAIEHVQDDQFVEETLEGLKGSKKDTQDDIPASENKEVEGLVSVTSSDQETNISYMSVENGTCHGGKLSANAEPKTDDQVEDEFESVGETEIRLDETTEAESHHRRNGEIATDESESSECKIDTFDSLPTTTEDSSEHFEVKDSGIDHPAVKISDKYLEEAADISTTLNMELKQEAKDLNGDQSESGDVVQTEERSDLESVTINSEELGPDVSLLDTVATDEKLDDVQIKTDTKKIDTFELLDIPPTQEESTDSCDENAISEDLQDKNGQHTNKSKSSSCPLPEHEDLSQPNQLDEGEEDEEDDEGQSFDFDDTEMEAAMALDNSGSSEQEEVEEAVEVVPDESNSGSSELDQSNAESKESTRETPVENNEACSTDVESGTEPQEYALAQEEALSENVEEQINAPKEESGVVEEAKEIGEEEHALNIGPLGAVAENINQTVSSLVEAGLDAVKHALHGEEANSAKTAEQAGDNKGSVQSGKDSKKSGKKGKGKGKDDCKMS
ncbi:uncharacterized protein lrrfip1a isoform 2-T2 [Pholidichthys leucotaenia]